MACYVDDAMIPYGRMKMSHMIANTTEELLEMVDRIGVQRKWIQKAGTSWEHFDICAAKRKLALEAGAVAVSRKDLVRMIRERRS
jgi:hypothetical protein